MGSLNPITFKINCRENITYNLTGYKTLIKWLCPEDRQADAAQKLKWLLADET